MFSSRGRRRVLRRSENSSQRQSRSPVNSSSVPAGVGTGTHLGAEKFNLAAGIKTVHVPAGRNDAIADVVARTIAGDTTYMFAPIEITLPHIREGRLRALGVSSARRSSLLPEVPTIAEAGVAGFNFPIWYGIWAPAGTPAGVVDKLAKDIGRVLAGQRSARLGYQARRRADEYDAARVRALRAERE